MESEQKQDSKLTLEDPHVVLGSAHHEQPTKFSEIKSEWVTHLVKGKPLPQLYGHTCSVIDRKLYIFGGRGTTAPIGPIEGYIVDTTTWEAHEIKTSEDDVVPRHRWGHSATVVDNRYIFVFGGFTSEYNLGDSWIFDTQTKKWTPVMSPNAPKYRAYHSCVAVGHKLILFGGSACVGGPYQYYNDTYVFDWDTREWQLLKQDNYRKPLARNQHTCGLWGKYMIIFGGYNGSSIFSDVYALDVTTYEWKAIKTHGNIPAELLDSLRPENFRVFPARRDGVIFGSKFFIFGHFRRSLLKDPIDIHCLDLRDLKWYKITQTECKYPPFSVFNRASHTCCLVDDSAIIFGGAHVAPQIHSISLLPFFAPLHFQELATKSLKILADDMRALLNSDDFKDVTFVFPKEGNKRIGAHKLILMARCPYFKAMFHSGLAESKQDTIILNEVTYSAFASLIEFLYTGATTTNNPTVLFELAHQYNVESLKEYCQYEIVNSLPSVSLNDVIKLLPVIEFYEAKDVLESCLELMAQHYMTVRDSELFRGLSQELQRKIEAKVNALANL
jgi:hypothetical protein